MNEINEIEFIVLRGFRFKIPKIDVYHFENKSPNYTQRPGIISIWRENQTNPIEIHYPELRDGKINPQYLEDKDKLDKALLGKTESESKLLP